MRETPYPRFLNAPASCMTQNAPEIVLSRRAGRLSVDPQLAFVVSKLAYRVEEADAAAYIAGYCAAICVTDYSVRDEIIEPATPQETNLSQVYGRWGDGYNVVGPLGDAPGADAGIAIEGQDGQCVRSTLAEYRHTPAQILHFISQGITLYPGDVVFCGRLSRLITLPAGAYEAGYRVCVHIDGLNALTTCLHK